MNGTIQLGPLVARAVSGDASAWEVLFSRFDPLLRRVVSGYRLSAADTDDVIQASWSAAFMHIERLREPEAFAGWLVVIARRHALRVLVRRRREIVSDEMLEYAPTTDATPESSVLAKERSRAVHAATRMLTHRQRAVISALFRNPGASYSDLAARLEMPIGSIGPTRDRALARLRRDNRLLAAL